jgi:hypothetical protein
MPYEELLKWHSYFEQRPFEWRADDRAAKLIQAQGVKEKPYNLFQSLNAIYNRPEPQMDDGMISTSNLKSSFLFHQMVSATGGDKIEL